MTGNAHIAPASVATKGNDAPAVSRFIPLSGSINFRDFGGYQTVDGRQVKWRHLYRCGSLSMLGDECHDAFAALGVSIICDLRRPDEVEMGPSPAHGPFRCRTHIPIDPGSSVMLRASLEDASQSAADRIRFMTELTRELPRNHTDEYRLLFKHLLEAERGFLLHCSAGKDRTGFGAGLILSALGVSHDTIMADYLLTNEAECLRVFMGERMRGSYGAHVDDESIEAITGVRPEYLQAAFDEVDRLYGSIDGFLEEIGVDGQARAELQGRLLVSPGVI